MAFADLILTDGTTLEGHRIDLAVVGTRIAEIAPSGTLRHRRRGDTTVLELRGRLLTPGLWDAHIHLYHWCQARRQLSLAGCADRDELLARVAGAFDGNGWLLGNGWNSSVWPDSRPPTRWELDERTGERPTLLWCSDLHSAVANTAALRQANLLEPGLTIAGGVIERDPDGSPNGWLKEMAANVIRQTVPEPSSEELQDLLEEGAHELLSLGVIGVCDQRIKDQDDGRAIMAALLALEREGRWPLRTSVNLAAHHLEQAIALGLTTGFGSDRVRFGHLKLFADGALGSRTARMLEPFSSGGCGPDGRGIYLTEPEEMRKTMARAAQAGWSISIHAIGDEANRVCLDLFEELDRAGVPRPRIPHRIEHVQLLSDADVGRFAQLDLTASVQAGHLLDDRAAAEEALGPRARLAYRFADLCQAGALLVFGTDAPVSRVAPDYGLRAALHRRWESEAPWFPQQRLSPESAWQGYTSNAARAAGWDGLTGSLELGQAADLVCWKGDIDQARDGRSLEPAHVIFDGKVVKP